MKKQHIYTAYGLLFSSELLLPELLEADGTPDIYIKLGKVPDTLVNPTGSGKLFQATPNEFLLKHDNIAGFYVNGGNEIIIEPATADNDLEIRLYLLGSVFGALLQQRGYLVLHGSSIAINGQGVLFTGKSGIGKSTLAAALQKKGYRVLTDDVCAVKLDNQGIPQIMPGFPSLKLWQDALKQLGAHKEGLSPVRNNADKFRIDLEASFFNQPVQLKKIFILGADDINEVRLTELEGKNKLQSVIRNTYRYRFLEGQGIKPRHFEQCVGVVNKTNIYKVVRPKTGFMIEQLISAIENIV